MCLLCCQKRHRWDRVPCTATLSDDAPTLLILALLGTVQPGLSARCGQCSDRNGEAKGDDLLWEDAKREMSAVRQPKDEDDDHEAHCLGLTLYDLRGYRADS